MSRNRRPSPPPEPPERLQKVLARSGVGSRRHVEGLIEAGEVTVNGRRAELGMRVSRDDAVRVAGRPVRLGAVRPPRVLLYHKPAGEISTRSDPEGRPTVFERLPRAPGGRWISVGRLDINTQGLLLFTDHGELANRLTHPSTGLEREYAVRVLGEVTREMTQNLLRGVPIDGVPARFARIAAGGGDGANHWFRVVLEEGRHREVHRLWESQGVRVSRLIRVRYGPVELPRGLRAGQWRELEPEACRALADVAGLPRPDPRAGR